MFPQEFVVTNSTEHTINVHAGHSEVLSTLGDYQKYPRSCRDVCDVPPGMTVTITGYTDSENPDHTYVVHAWDAFSGLIIFSRQFEKEELEESGWAVEIVDMWEQ